jgi:hypothetical protein
MERPMSPKLALIGAVLALGYPTPPHAHDIYSNLVDVFGSSCCNERDCLPAHFRLTGTGVLMYVYGHWIEVPNETIQYRALLGDDGKTGGGHWCGKVYDRNGVVLMTRCAVLPPNSASMESPRSHAHQQP